MNAAPRCVVMAFAAALAAVIFWAASGTFLLHADIGWHLAAGDLIRELHAVPATDPWSFSAGGMPWYNLSWGWDVLAAALYAQGGLFALLGMTVLLGAVLVALLAEKAFSAGVGAVMAIAGANAVGVALVGMGLAVTPMVASMLLFLLFWRLLERACAHRRFRAFLPLPFLLPLWVNLHGAYPLAFVLLAAYGLQALARRDKALAWRMAGAVLLCMLAVPLNPLGLEIVSATAQALGGATKQHLSEWKPFTLFSPFAAASVYLLAFILWVDWRTPRISPAGRGLALLFLVAGLMQFRHFPYFLFTSLPLLLVGVQARMQASKSGAARLSARAELHIAQDFSRAFPRRVAVALALGIVLFHATPWALRLVHPPGLRFPASMYPAAEIAYVLERHSGQRLFNHWNLGGYIIFDTRGKIPLLVDGRAETVYPAALLTDVFDSAKTQALIDRYDLRLAMMPKYVPESLTFFMQNPHWKPVFSGSVATVFERID